PLRHSHPYYTRTPPPPTHLPPLSLHDALPISRHTLDTTVVSHPPRFSISAASDRLSRSHASCTASSASFNDPSILYATPRRCPRDRKSTRLNSSHDQISYAVFCLKKKRNKTKE